MPGRTVEGIERRGRVPRCGDGARREGHEQGETIHRGGEAVFYKMINSRGMDQTARAMQFHLVLIDSIIRGIELRLILERGAVCFAPWSENQLYYFS